MWNEFVSPCSPFYYLLWSKYITTCYLKCLTTFLTHSFIVLFVIVASAIKCWRCSSDASNAAFCDDPFDASIINEQQRRWSYVDCSYPPGQLNPYSQSSTQRAVCKKTKQLGMYWISIRFEKITFSTDLDIRNIENGTGQKLTMILIQLRK